MCCVLAISKTFIYSLSKYVQSAKTVEVYTPEQMQQRRIDRHERRRGNDENPLTIPNIKILRSKGVTLSLLLTSLFSYFLFLLLLLSVNDYPNSSGIKYIIMATLPSYLFGTLLLSRT